MVVSLPGFVSSGVRQGGILSLFLFNIYIDSVISSLRLSDHGCHLREEYVACIVLSIAFPNTLPDFSSPLTSTKRQDVCVTNKDKSQRETVAVVVVVRTKTCS